MLDINKYMDNDYKNKLNKKNSIKKWIISIICVIIVIVGITSITLVDNNIRKSAFSSDKPLFSIKKEQNNIKTEFLGKEFNFNLNIFNNIINNTEKFRALLPIDIRIKSEAGIFVCAYTTSFIKDILF